MKSWMLIIFLTGILVPIACKNKNPQPTTQTTAKANYSNASTSDSVSGANTADSQLSPAVHSLYPSYIIDSARYVIHLITEDSLEKLAELMPYPISRGFPPVIKNKKEFTTEYKYLFDSLSKEFKTKPVILDFQTLEVLNGRYRLLNLFDFCGNGRIADMCYQPLNCNTKLQEWKYHDKKSLGTALRKDFISNSMICETDTLLFRLDETTHGPRLALWKKGENMDSAPAKIIFAKSTKHYFGSYGLFEYYFTDSNLNYKIYNRMGCRDTEGVWMDIRSKNQKKSWKCSPLK